MRLDLQTLFNKKLDLGLKVIQTDSLYKMTSNKFRFIDGFVQDLIVGICDCDDVDVTDDMHGTNYVELTTEFDETFRMLKSDFNTAVHNTYIW